MDTDTEFVDVTLSHDKEQVGYESAEAGPSVLGNFSGVTVTLTYN